MLPVTKIQKFCTHDGPGIRTTVFLKGCPLHCIWCHNPETQLACAELFYSPQLCISCGACAAVCPQKAHSMASGHQLERSQCTACMACTAVCPTGALEACTQLMSAEEIIAEVMKDRVFYGSEGGLTLSGGEPLMQAEFVRELFELCHQKGINTCLDTSGCIINDGVRSLLSVCDRVLLDVKYTESELYSEHVGCELDRVISFLDLLYEMNIPTVLRQVIIPTLNDSEENVLRLKAIGDSRANVEKIELLPFRKICSQKYDNMGIEFIFGHQPEPDAESMRKLNELL